MSHLTHRDYNDSGQRKSRALLSVLQAENGDESVDVLVDKIVEIAEEVLDSERVLLLFVDRAQLELYTLNCPLGLPASQSPHPSGPLLLPLNRGIAGFVARTGTIVRADDAAAHAEWDDTVDQALGSRTQSCLCIPILNVANAAHAVLLAINKRMCRDAAPEPSDDDDAAGAEEGVIPFTEEDQDIANYLCQGAGYTLRRRLTEVIMIRSRGRPGEGIDRETQSMLDMYGNTRQTNAGYNASYDRQMDRTMHGKRRSLGPTAFPSSVLHTIMHSPSIPEQHYLQPSLSDSSAFQGREGAGGGSSAGALNGSGVSSAASATVNLTVGLGSPLFLPDNRRATWSRTMSTPFKGRRTPLVAKYDLSQTTDLSAVNAQQQLQHPPQQQQHSMSYVQARRSSSGGSAVVTTEDEEQLSAELHLDGSGHSHDSDSNGGSNGSQPRHLRQLTSAGRSSRGGSLYGVQGTAWLSPRGAGRKTLISGSQQAASYNYTLPFSMRPPQSSHAVSAPSYVPQPSPPAAGSVSYHQPLHKQTTHDSFSPISRPLSLSSASFVPAPASSSSSSAVSSSSVSSFTPGSFAFVGSAIGSPSTNQRPRGASFDHSAQAMTAAAAAVAAAAPSSSSFSSAQSSSSTSPSRFYSPALTREPSLSLPSSGGVLSSTLPFADGVATVPSSTQPSSATSPLLAVSMAAPSPPRMSLSELTLLSPAPWAAVTIERADSAVSCTDSESEMASTHSSTLSAHPPAYSFYSSTASFASTGSTDVSRTSSSSTASIASTCSASSSSSSSSSTSSSSSSSLLSSSFPSSSPSTVYVAGPTASGVAGPLSNHLISAPNPATFASVSVALPWPVLQCPPLSDMGELATLNFNVFDHSDDQLLHCCFHMLDSLDLVSAFSLSLPTLQCFLLGVRSKYRTNPYHNFYHAVSVMQFAYFSVCKTELHEALPKLDQLALLVGCLCHDIDHPGTNNAFQVLAASELALLHNDQAVLENHHAATTFALLCCPDMSIFSPLHSALSTDDVRAVRKMMISSILSTDMARHFEMCHELDNQQPECADIEWDKEQHRQFILNLITHSADLSGQITPLHIAQQWEERIAKEFMQQSLMELHYGLPLTAYLQDMHIERVRLKNHLNFLNFVMTPLWTGLVEMFPSLRECAENLVNNRKYFMDRVRDEEANAADGLGHDCNGGGGGATHHQFSVDLTGAEDADEEYEEDVSEEDFHIADSGDAVTDLEPATAPPSDTTVVTIHDSRSRCTSLDESASDSVHMRAMNGAAEGGSSVMFAIDENRPLHHRFASSSDSAFGSPSVLSSRTSAVSSPSRSPSGSVAASILSSPLTSGRNSLLQSANISSRSSPHLQPSIAHAHLPFVPLSISINGVIEEGATLSVPVSPHSSTSASGSDSGAVRKHESIKDRRESRWGDQLINTAPPPPATLSPASSTASLSPVTPPPPPLLLSPLTKDAKRQPKQSIGERRVSVIQSLQQAHADKAPSQATAGAQAS